nr:MAG TPA: hypothetical protein [Caudoviricetes sp.]
MEKAVNNEVWCAGGGKTYLIWMQNGLRLPSKP